MRRQIIVFASEAWNSAGELLEACPADPLQSVRIAWQDGRQHDLRDRGFV